ncbi:MAG: glycosyltransferase family 4 protein [Aureliella sp.]
MRLLLNDYGGYPFPIELSRELASRGHEVLHTYCGSLATTPGGEHQKRSCDPDKLEISSILLKESLDKYSFVKRWRQEREYGRRLLEQLKAFNPEVVISANTPLDAQIPLQVHCRVSNVPFAFWLQDILSVATEKILRQKIPVIGKWVGRYYLSQEKAALQKSDWVIAITRGFLPLLDQWGVESSKVSVIENWAPIHELPIKPRENPWAKSVGLDAYKCFIYTGTMGMKHNPQLLLDLAKAMEDRCEVRVVVISQGKGADWLKQEIERHNLGNLLVFDYGPFEQVPDVMGTALGLIAILEEDASTYSVPSKVLAYLCARRPLLLSVPKENLAAQIVSEAEAGFVVAANDSEGLIQAATALLDDEAKCIKMGIRARQYAEAHFDIAKIADQFERRLSRMLG